MKKTIHIILSLILAVSLMATTALGANEEDFEQQVKDATEAYLRSCMEGIYFHEDTMPAELTIIDSAAPVSRESMTTASMFATLSQVEAEAELPLFESVSRESSGLQAMTEALALQEAKVSFYGHLYETQDISYQSFDAEYLFHEVSVDGNCAVVDVSEVLNYQYSDCADPTYELIKYNIALIRVDGEWLIADVVSDDPFFQQNYNNDSFNLESAIQGYDIALASAEAAEAATVSALPSSANDIGYNKQNAVNYALTYTTSTDSGSTPVFKNNLFRWWGADCMNFASQCVWAGFGGSNSSMDIQSGYGMDKTGTYTWWANATTAASPWISCSSFRTYVKNSAGASEKGLQCSIAATAYNSDILPYSASDLIGAVLHVKGSSNGSPVSGGHAVFVNNATSNSRSGIYYCSYNNCAKNKKLSLSFNASSTDTYQGITTIIPQSFQDGASGARLWADLHNVVVDKNKTVTLTGYSSNIMANLHMIIQNPNGVPVMDYIWNTTDSVSVDFSGFNMSGEWRIQLKGTDKTGNVTNFYYTVRVR